MHVLSYSGTSHVCFALLGSQNAIRSLVGQSGICLKMQLQGKSWDNLGELGKAAEICGDLWGAVESLQGIVEIVGTFSTTFSRTFSRTFSKTFAKTFSRVCLRIFPKPFSRTFSRTFSLTFLKTFLKTFSRTFSTTFSWTCCKPFPRLFPESFRIPF